MNSFAVNAADRLFRMTRSIAKQDTLVLLTLKENPSFPICPIRSVDNSDCCRPTTPRPADFPPASQGISP